MVFYTIFATFNQWNDDERNVNVNRNDNDWNDNWWFAGLRKFFQLSHPVLLLCVLLIFENEYELHLQVLLGMKVQ